MASAAPSNSTAVADCASAVAEAAVQLLPAVAEMESPALHKPPTLSSPSPLQAFWHLMQKSPAPRPSPPLSSVLSASLPARLPPRRYASMRLLPSCLVHLPVSSSLLGALCIAAGSLASAQVCKHASTPFLPCPSPRLLLSPRCSLHRCRLACLRAGMQACVYSLLALSISPSPPLSSVLSASLPARLPPCSEAVGMVCRVSCASPVSSSLPGALCTAAVSLASAHMLGGRFCNLMPSDVQKRGAFASFSLPAESGGLPPLREKTRQDNQFPTFPTTHLPSSDSNPLHGTLSMDPLHAAKGRNQGQQVRDRELKGSDQRPLSSLRLPPLWDKAGRLVSVFLLVARGEREGKVWGGFVRVGRILRTAHAETTFSSEAPQNQTPQNEAPQNQTPQNEAPQNQTPQNEAPQNLTPQMRRLKTGFVRGGRILRTAHAETTFSNSCLNLFILTPPSQPSIADHIPTNWDVHGARWLKRSKHTRTQPALSVPLVSSPSPLTRLPVYQTTSPPTGMCTGLDGSSAPSRLALNLPSLCLSSLCLFLSVPLSSFPSQHCRSHPH
ncbi:unnamed protein product [Closterium sp. NIES-64]|nr:unnamed protein product [Closterium sp. NIES-64]